MKYQDWLEEGSGVDEIDKCCPDCGELIEESDIDICPECGCDFEIYYKNLDFYSNYGI